MKKKKKKSLTKERKSNVINLRITRQSERRGEELKKQTLSNLVRLFDSPNRKGKKELRKRNIMEKTLTKPN